ncbi:MAG: peptidase M14 family protein, partial [Candidatus Bathyarchaeia archaeon]
FKALNLLIERGLKVERFEEVLCLDGLRLPSGAFMVEGGNLNALKEAADATGVDFIALRDEPRGRRREVRRLRVGLYQRYWGGNMDEGWTRWLLEQFCFPYKSLKDEEVKKGRLNDVYDAIIIPDDATPFITGIGVEEWMREHRPDWPQPFYPPEYRGGIGEEGVKAINDFVENGGTLITLGGACDFAIEKLGLNVRNPLKGLKPKEFFCPGSTLRACVDNSHPLGYGMPEKTLVFFWNNPAFEIIPSKMNEFFETVVQYPERDILQSGWLIGEERISKKIGMLVARKGKGRVVLIGFRPQHRCQTHGTFKLLFNALIS